MGGPGHGLADDFEPPMMTFLSTAAGLLDRDQFVILAQYLSDNRPDRPGHMDRPGRHGGVRQGTEGNGFGDRMAGRLAEELGLSDEQASALRQVVSSYRDRFRDLREAVRDGQTSPSDALADAITLASAMKAELAAVLTAEQLELFAEHKSERVIQGIERRLGNLDERMTQRSAMIAAALDMDDAQAQQTESIFIGTVAARSAVLNGLWDGSIAPEVAAFRVIAIEKDAWAEVYALLTPEQQAAWDSLRNLLPGSRGGF
jgi:hypothetical protein